MQRLHLSVQMFDIRDIQVLQFQYRFLFFEQKNVILLIFYGDNIWK